jgi:hypothetical protein
MKVGPFSFNGALFASGKLVIMPSHRTGGAYFGFYNSQHQEWHPRSSMAVRTGAQDRPHPKLKQWWWDKRIPVELLVVAPK